MLFKDFFSKFKSNKIESTISEENNRLRKKSKLKNRVLLSIIESKTIDATDID